MKTFKGRVVGKKTPQTAIVEVEHFLVHPIYEKRTKRNKRYPVHDPEGKAKEGDFVEFVGVKPVSRTKKWQVKRIMM